MIKECSACSKHKILSKFKKDKRLKSGVQSYCKECAKEKQLMYSRTRDGLVTNIISKQVSKSKQRGHIPPEYNKIEFKQWLLNHHAFNDLFKAWEDSNYNTDDIPSCDRIDDSLGYSFENITLTTWRENNMNGRISKRKAIRQLSKEGVFISNFESITAASIDTNIERRNINAACLGKLKSAGGYKWAYLI